MQVHYFPPSSQTRIQPSIKQIERKLAGSLRERKKRLQASAATEPHSVPQELQGDSVGGVCVCGGGFDAGVDNKHLACETHGCISAGPTQRIRSADQSDHCSSPGGEASVAALEICPTQPRHHLISSADLNLAILHFYANIRRCCSSYLPVYWAMASIRLSRRSTFGPRATTPRWCYGLRT